MATKRSYLILLSSVLSVVTLLVIGLGLAVYAWMAGDREAADPIADRSEVTSQGRRDAIAAEPMLATSKADATSGTPALGDLAGIQIPRATGVGPLGIPTGYPQIPEGAAAQLGEILVAAFSAMSIEHAQDVEGQWMVPSPQGREPWLVVQAIQTFLRSGQLTDGLAAQSSIRVVPAGAQIKGSDGADWHVACVLLDLTYTYKATARMAYGHCERMVWTDGRWIIDAGSAPAMAPSTWPRSERFAEAGWLVWTEGT